MVDRALEGAVEALEIDLSDSDQAYLETPYELVEAIDWRFPTDVD